MSKNAKVGLPTVACDDKYFIAVDDVTIFYGTKGQMEEKDTQRVISHKFVNSPLKAIVNLVYSVSPTLRWNTKNSYDERVKPRLINGMNYCPSTKCYVWYEYLTENSRPPKDVQTERFNKGQYKFFKIRHEIQVLSTNVEKIALDDLKKDMALAKEIVVA